MWIIGMFDKYQRGVVERAPIFNAMHGSNQFFIIACVGARLSREPRRINPRRATQCRHANAGVICERGQSGCA